ncbi:MAG: hypothetical protein V5A46_08450 [Haloferacaceae archaeon]
MVELVSLGAIVLQGGIAAVLLTALRRRNAAAATNAFVSLSLSVLPLFLEYGSPFLLSGRLIVPPALPFWIAGAGFLHSVGMLGPYNDVWWWDHLTHAVSAALVAALAYAGLLVAAEVPGAVGGSRGTVALLTVGYTMAAGVLWELIELVARQVGERYDVEPVLIHYGWRDTALDLVFDMVGALSVILLDVRIFVPLAEQFPVAAQELVLTAGATLLVGSLLLSAPLFVGGLR